MSFDFYSWVGLPLIIFASRVCDVSLGTLRHVFISKGYRKIVPVLGFFEVLIWILVVKQLMSNIGNWVSYIAWAGGFATGTYVGLIIEERLALGLQIIRIITNQDCAELITAIKNANHGITVVDAQGAKGSVKIIFTVVKRKDVPQIASLISKYNSSAFYSVEDIRESSYGVFSQSTGNMAMVRRMISSKK
jgi:uncharacterized protein YebE (UPF0316 family)